MKRYVIMQLTKDKECTIMDFRTFSLEMIHYAINSGANLLSGGDMYVKAIKRELIGQYAETFILNDEEIKLYGKSVNSLRKMKMLQVILVSKKCKEELDNGKVPYYEHIEPLSRIYTNICSLSSKDMQSLKKAMKYCKIVGLSQEEKEFLDRNPNNHFTSEDEQLLKKWEWESVIGKDNVKYAIRSMEDPITGTMLNTQKSGTAYARIAHLVNNKVEFIWMADPCSRTEKSQIEIIKDYLENTCYKYNYDPSTEKWKKRI